MGNEAVSEQDKPKDTLIKEEQQPVQFTLPTITITEPPNECSNENAETVESVSVGSETEAIEADAATAETEILDETAAAKPVQLVPLCQDPISHEWYPLPVVCQMFRSQGRIYDLEALLWGSQGIRPEDRKCIYFWTLQTYADFGMFPQAVDLTRRLETEGLGLEFPEYHSMMNNFAMAVYSQQKLLENSNEVNHEPSPTPVSPVSSIETEEQAALQSHFYRKLKKAITNKDVESCTVNY